MVLCMVPMVAITFSSHQRIPMSYMHRPLRKNEKVDSPSWVKLWLVWVILLATGSCIMKAMGGERVMRTVHLEEAGTDVAGQLIYLLDPGTTTKHGNATSRLVFLCRAKGTLLINLQYYRHIRRILLRLWFITIAHCVSANLTTPLPKI